MSPIVKGYVKKVEMTKTNQRDSDGGPGWSIALYHDSSHALRMHLWLPQNAPVKINTQNVDIVLAIYNLF